MLNNPNATREGTTRRCREPRVVVLGGGASGLGFAWKLAEYDIPCDIIEIENFIGGLSGTIRQDKYCLDVGPHSLFSEDVDILSALLGLFDTKLTPSPREVKFYYNGTYLDYPLTASNILFQMGFSSGVRALLSFLKGKILPSPRRGKDDEAETVEEWAISSFGEHLYRSFFKPYTEQFWRVPCNELSSRSIPTHTRMSFINTCRLLLRRRSARTKDSSLAEREMLPTYYPPTGFGEIPEHMANLVRKAGGQIHLACHPTSITRVEGGGMLLEYMENGQTVEIECSQLVSTIPLHALLNLLHPTPPEDVLIAASALEYRALLVLGMVTEKQDVLGCGYIYMLDRPYNRISEMNEFSPATSPPGDNIIAVEIPCLVGGPLWSASREEIFEACINSLVEDGFLSRDDVKELLLVKTPYAYPIYRKDYACHLQRVLDYIKQDDCLSTLGRTGEFMYMDLDKCVRHAFDFAESFVRETALT